MLISVPYTLKTIRNKLNANPGNVGKRNARVCIIATRVMPIILLHYKLKLLNTLVTSFPLTRKAHILSKTSLAMANSSDNIAKSSIESVREECLLGVTLQRVFVVVE